MDFRDRILNDKRMTPFDKDFWIKQFVQQRAAKASPFAGEESEPLPSETPEFQRKWGIEGVVPNAPGTPPPLAFTVGAKNVESPEMLPPLARGNFAPPADAPRIASGGPPAASPGARPFSPPLPPPRPEGFGQAPGSPTDDFSQMLQVARSGPGILGAFKPQGEHVAMNNAPPQPGGILDGNLAGLFGNQNMPMPSVDVMPQQPFPFPFFNWFG